MVQDSASGDRTGVSGRVVLDLALIVAYTALAYAVILLSVAGSGVSTIIGTGFILFVPGYAFVAALFPERPDPTTDRAGLNVSLNGGRIDLLERVALAFVASILVVTVLSFLLDVSSVGIQPEPFVRGLSAFTLAATAIAAIRRLALPAEQRFGVSAKLWPPTSRGAIWSPEDPLDMAMHVVVIGALMAGLVTAGYAVSVPQSGESFTEFYVLTENEDGELVAGEYPTEAVEGEQQDLVVGVGNQEHQRENYSLVVRLQRVDSNDSSTVLEEQAIADRRVGPLAHNVTERHRLTFSPEITGEKVRLQLLLFRGSPPETPSASNAYRDLHIWLTVTPDGVQSLPRVHSLYAD